MCRSGPVNVIVTELPVGTWTQDFKEMLDVEVGGQALEGLFHGLLMMLLLFFIPISFVINPLLVAIPFGLDFSLFFLPTILFISVKLDHVGGWSFKEISPIHPGHHRGREEDIRQRYRTSALVVLPGSLGGLGSLHDGPDPGGHLSLGETGDRPRPHACARDLLSQSWGGGDPQGIRTS